MKKILLFIVFSVVLSCGNKKVLQLPEINDIKDVSAAYLFYDETVIDCIELNRKNLISSTNWLINVDKRLTLKQAIPKIKFLLDKRIVRVIKKKALKMISPAIIQIERI